jgi:cell division protein DivIC
MKRFFHIPSLLTNKYLLVFIAFTVWMLFFDDRDFVTTHIRYPKELNELKESKAYYEAEIKATKEELKQLKSNAATIEKYAREHFLMKRDNEDLFLFFEETAN